MKKISEEEIESLGFRHVGSYSNGGSKTYQRGKELFTIDYHGNNFIYIKNDDPRRHEIEIKTIDTTTHKFITLYIGVPENIDELRELVLKYCSTNLTTKDHE